MLLDVSNEETTNYRNAIGHDSAAEAAADIIETNDSNGRGFGDAVTTAVPISKRSCLNKVFMKTLRSSWSHACVSL